jgi:hypothetical protein
MASRRLILHMGAAGGLTWALRSLATGIPLEWFSSPQVAWAQSASEAKFLILSTSMEGDPVMCNTPGTYGIDIGNHKVMHPPGDALFKEKSIRVGGTAYKSAAVWEGLKSSVLERTAFFYFDTGAVSHTEEGKVLRLMGGVLDNEMFVSSMAKLLNGRLKTIQAQPITLGTKTAAESIYYEGQPQPQLNPLGVKHILTRNKSNPLENLQNLRDNTLKAVCHYLKTDGNEAQKKYLDGYIKSQEEARAISEDLLSLLSSVEDNSPASQVSAAMVLIRLNCTPVVTIHIPFGGDNHSDGGLEKEAIETRAGVQTIQYLMEQLGVHGLSNRVIFALYNVFGRTMSYAQRENNGRDHHHEAGGGIVIGSNIRGGVYGRLSYIDAISDFGALPMHSKTGEGALNGDISERDGMGAFAKTIGTALGVSKKDLDEHILLGTAIENAVI